MHPEATPYPDLPLGQERESFFDAVGTGDIATLEKYLKKYGPAVLNMRDRALWTPLMYAALYSTPRTLEFLLDHGALIGLQSAFGKTALTIAEQNNRDQNVKFIQEYPRLKQEKLQQAAQHKHTAIILKLKQKNASSPFLKKRP